MDALDEALVQMRPYGPEYPPFPPHKFELGNHGPMVAEALCAMGRPDTVADWVERYVSRLTPPRPRTTPIEVEHWQAALGDAVRASDWTELFDEELEREPWRDVLNRWVPRLAPGTYGGLHGVIRSAHAVRALLAQETEARVHELAEGLAYWAWAYVSLPERAGRRAGLLPSQALAHVEQLDLTDRTGWSLFTEPIGRLDGSAPFASVADLVDLEDPPRVLSDLTEAFAAILVTNVATVNPRALCHGFTVAGATRMMLPALNPNAAESALRYAWQLAAAFYAALVLEPPVMEVASPTESVELLFDDALACRDEHAIKVLDLALGEDALNPNPVYLAAARETTRRLHETGLQL